jgi:23S rRNA (guanosine2251-2'-O)-methyltransferase
MKTVWIYGKHAAMAALANPNRKIHEIRCTKSMKELLPKGFRVVEVSTDELLRLTKGNHQGIAICAEAIQIEKKVPKLEVSKVLILDHLQDVANIGGIMRTMVALNFRCLITNQRGSPNLEQCSVKSSCGAIEKLQLIQVPNIRHAIIELKKQDFTCIALDHEGDPIAQIKMDKIALVVGSEDEGLSMIVKKECDRVFRLNTTPDFPVLNVGIAAGIGMYTVSN